MAQQPLTRQTFATRFLRLTFNRWPAIRGTGVRVAYIAPGLDEIRVRLALSLRTFNLVGTMFGGSLYGACDPWFMVILLRKLGPDYIVWDKAASIRFRKPGTRTLYARFQVEPDEIATIQSLLETESSIERTYTVDLIDADGAVYATVEKLVYVRKSPRSDQLHNLLSRVATRMISRV